MSENPSGDERGFFSRYGVVIGALGLLAGGGYAVASMLKGGDKPAPKKAAEMPMVRLAPPPPPPPPKPPEPKPEQPEKAPDPTEQKMIDQAPVASEEKPAETPAADPAPADAPMGTSIQGSGDDGFGLAYSRTGGGNTIGGTGTGGTGSGGSGLYRWGAYAGRVQSRVSKALSENKSTRSAALDLRVRVRVDATGRISGVELIGGTGDAELDAALKGEVLTGLPLGEAPPDDMPMPIVMRITGRRP